MPQFPARHLAKPFARQLWLHAQGLTTAAPFGTGPAATLAATRQLGYVQIDTINVIERSHHHILATRIPDYRRDHLAQAQSVDKTVFEYWTHALSYVPVEDYRFYLPAMQDHRNNPRSWFDSVDRDAVRRLLKRIEAEGALSLRDIDDDVLVDKTHAWGSRKPSQRAMKLAFYQGALTVSARSGILKTYELTDRHFGWPPRPRTATPNQITAYLLDRALRAQAIVSLDSICHLDAPSKPAVRALIEQRVKRKTLVPVQLDDTPTAYWAEPATLDASHAPLADDQVHILSPFDPLIIQRKRLMQFFDYFHRFEAYVPAAKRVLGYFALPVLLGDRIVAAIDLKTDRAQQALRVQQWTWFEDVPAAGKQAIDHALHRFEAFQLGREASPDMPARHTQAAPPFNVPAELAEATAQAMPPEIPPKAPRR
ncbi:winged helix-turn-helix domain-containing protein [Pigmentiphaga aceris]|uniref:Winged helix-turn-helix domain-containing protein n=1 Tax=Pigmentiphaga aceris TaxID=1940612 RepID=A0A5C0B2C4_9BURK|nr:crosslink repair DNA glycosylase YcaQ family protein [Pigmentiphaga aceris]QEI08908.1 winged helix-turn-helix domain-containing protein [Pigmentiphaga aceris]